MQLVLQHPLFHMYCHYYPSSPPVNTVSAQQWVDWVHGCAGNPLLVESVHNIDFCAQVA